MISIVIELIRIRYGFFSQDSIRSDTYFKIDPDLAVFFFLMEAITIQLIERQKTLKMFGPRN